MPLEFLSKARAVHWVIAAAAILLLDYITGPVVEFPILFVLPVALATITHGSRIGVLVGMVLPLVKLSFFLKWGLPSSWVLETIDTAVDVAFLMGFSLLIHGLLEQQRAIRALEGMLPICALCMKIRDEDGQWRQLESFITERSSAQFSHTFCQECAQKHYPSMTD